MQKLTKIAMRKFKESRKKHHLYLSLAFTDVYETYVFLAAFVPKPSLVGFRGTSLVLLLEAIITLPSRRRFKNIFSVSKHFSGVSCFPDTTENAAQTEIPRFGPKSISLVTATKFKATFSPFWTLEASPMQ